MKKENGKVISMKKPKQLAKPIKLADILKDMSKDISQKIQPIPYESAKSKADYVNHPPHYTSHPSGVECITITQHMNFNLGNAMKYIWRADLKKNSVEDLQKARWYINKELERLTTYEREES